MFSYVSESIPISFFFLSLTYSLAGGSTSHIVFHCYRMDLKLDEMYSTYSTQSQFKYMTV